MALSRRNSVNALNIWPGFVDALATLLMVIIFLLMIFVVAQFFLNDAIIGRDRALEGLNRQVEELADLLALERQVGQDLRNNINELSGELRSTLTAKDSLETSLWDLRSEHAKLGKNLEDTESKLSVSEKESITLRQQLGQLQKDIDIAHIEHTKLGENLEDTESKLFVSEKERITLRQQLNQLRQEIDAMRMERNLLAKDLATTRKNMEMETKTARIKLVEQQILSQAAKARVDLLNRQMAEFRKQITRLNSALEAAEAKAKVQNIQLVNLGKRLNAALASKVQELAKYRSEFFGRLRQVLGNRRDIRVVGDRFVFQSEVLFSSGSAKMQERGKSQLAQLAKTLKLISNNIPDDLKWILRVDGHTDRMPIQTTAFPSNWELSTARAISVVKFLMSEGIPSQNLAATGFGEFQPLDLRDDEIAFRRNRRIELKLDQR